ncbi:MAG: trigger factor [Clostridiales bacterium]|nr:trigger factor [Clostridiales bacterium]
MSSEVIKREENKITLKVVIPAEEFEKGINKAYNKLKSRFNIPGFRKGKAPKKIIELNYGAEIFYEEAINFTFSDAYEKVLDDNKIEPIDRPSIEDIDEIKKGEDVVLTVTVDVMPEITVENYKGIEVEKTEYNVQEEDVEKELNDLVERNARLISVEDRSVKDGDMVIIDYQGMIDGVAFEGGTATKQTLTIGSGQFIPGFEEGLIGANLGEEVDVNVTFPEDYHSEELAGKEAVFKVTVHEIKEKELSELDDEFVKDVSEFDTLEELRVDIKKKLEMRAEERTENEFRQKVIDSVVDLVEVELPEVVVERQIDAMVREFAYSLSHQGLNIEYYYAMTGTTEEDLRSQMREEAAKKVKTDLVLDTIRELEDIKATEEEVEEEITKMAEQYGQDVEQFKESFKNRDITFIEENIALRKTIDFLVDNAKVL